MALRRLQELEVAVEVRIAKVSDATLAQVGLEPSGNPDKPVVLSDTQLFQLLEAAQGDRATSIMQAPKITVFNGQRAAINVTNKEAMVTDVETARENDRFVIRPKKQIVTTGLVCKVRPVVSADRQTVNLSFSLDLSNLSKPLSQLPVVVMGQDAAGKEHPIRTGLVVQVGQLNRTTLDTVLRIPDGQTAVLFAGTDKVETSTEFGTPVLSKIPYMNRIFGYSGQDRASYRTLVLVTPRIVVNEEEGSQASGEALAHPTSQGSSVPENVLLVPYLEPERLVKRQPTSNVCNIATSWDNCLTQTTDMVNGGAPLWGLKGRLYLFGPEAKMPITCEGELCIDLYDDRPLASSAQPVRLERWHFPREIMAQLARKDRIGWGYTIFLPWVNSYRPDITLVHFQIRFMPSGSSTPLHDNSGSITLSHSDCPVPPTRSEQELVGQ
jgi:hypothetical protein